MGLMELVDRFATVDSIVGQTFRARLTGVAIGEMCAIHESAFSDTAIGQAQVVALLADTAVLSVLNPIEGFHRGCVLRPTGKRMSVLLSTALLGTVLDASGHVVERLTDGVSRHIDAEQEMALDGPGPAYYERDARTEPLWTGIRAIDGLLTCALGQRVGIFAAAGSGKSSLLSMLIGGVDADVSIVALIGERGREVSEFVDRLRDARAAERFIVVYATSDQSAVERANAAKVAMAAAEYFRDLGRRVVLYVDSLTRYARAERDIALSSGEVPVKRGYPLSVFDRLPKLIERAGRTATGSITAFYTVLLESEEEADLVADEFRSLLDGHLYLSRALAETHHYPAIDILKSASRLFGAVTDSSHQSMAAAFRQRLAKYQELQVYIDVGEYKSGQNAENDRVVDSAAAIRRCLVQPQYEQSSFADTQRLMREATR
jgi:type III secretion protein N (ATPase)